MLTLGAAERVAAETTSGCAGKPLCVSITGTPDPASRSPVGTDHFVSYSVTVANDGTTSNLVNVTVAATWADVGAETTSAYQSAASDSRCSVTGTQALTCTTPKSLAPGASETYALVFRTATDLGEPPSSATDTTITVTAAAKEQAKPSKGGTNTAFVTVSNTTSYEPEPELDVSTAGGGLTTTLGTASGAGGQSAKLRVPGDDAPRGLFRLEETSVYTCPTGLDCFGQQVVTVATGLSPVNVQTTYTGDLPAGTNEGSVVVHHVRDDATEIIIGTPCSGALFSGEPPSTEIPCRRIEITHLPGGIATVEMDIWDTTNGRFTGGG